MEDPRVILKWSLLTGGTYFTLVSAAHFFSFKVPLLYVYYDVPSTPYQDLIISFMALGWALFHAAGYSSLKRNSLRSVRYIVMAGAGGVAGLAYINAFTDFTAMNAASNALIYWGETAGLSVYVAWLAYWYIASKQF
jgi:hypothetical protein